MTKDKFKDKIKKITFSQSQAHFILRNKIRKDSVTANPVGVHPSHLVSAKGGHVEHILPQEPENWDEKWSEDGKPSELHIKMVNRIGNLTILDASTNSSLGNKSWEQKKEVYENMNWVVTSEIAANENWDEAEIKARSGDLADWIASVWWSGKLNPEEDETNNEANEANNESNEADND